MIALLDAFCRRLKRREKLRDAANVIADAVQAAKDQDIDATKRALRVARRQGRRQQRKLSSVVARGRALGAVLALTEGSIVMPAIELFQKIATRLRAPLAHVLAFDDVESSGEGFWDIDGERLPSVRFEGHHFGRLTGHRFAAVRPDLSHRSWQPEKAARTHEGAWRQVRDAMALDDDAAKAATSWGRMQVMGFNWRGLRYPSVDAFVESMATDEGQLEAFARYIEADPVLHRAVIKGDWQTIEDRYNGGGYGGKYARKMKAAALRFAGQSPAAIQAPRPLRRGDRGDDVAELQTALVGEGHELGAIDGDFGPATEAAVRAFQAANGLVVDGIAGRMTKAELGMVK